AGTRPTCRPRSAAPPERPGRAAPLASREPAPGAAASRTTSWRPGAAATYPVDLSSDADVTRGQSPGNGRNAEHVREERDRVGVAAGRGGVAMSKRAHKPIGWVLGAAAGAVAGAVFKRVWHAVADQDEAPVAMDERSTWAEVLGAAALQGLIFAVVKAAV